MDQCWRRSGDYITVVHPDSALLQLPDSIEVKIPLHADHSSIVKFNSKTSPGYTSALEHLKRFEQDAPSIVAARFGMSRARSRSSLLPAVQPSHCFNPISFD